MSALDIEIPEEQSLWHWLGQFRAVELLAMALELRGTRPGPGAEDTALGGVSKERLMIAVADEVTGRPS